MNYRFYVVAILSFFIVALVTLFIPTSPVWRIQDSNLVAPLGFSQDGSELYLLRQVQQVYEIRRCHVGDGALLGTVVLVSTDVSPEPFSLACSPDMKWLALTDQSKRLWVFDMKSGNPLGGPHPVEDYSHKATFSSNSQYCYYVGPGLFSTRCYRSINLTNGEEVDAMPCLQSVNELDSNSTKGYLAARVGGDLYLVDLKSAR